jgi:hypothetical protein
MKKFFYGMIALLSVSLFSIGCETEVEKFVDRPSIIHFDRTVSAQGTLEAALLEDGPLTIAVTGTGITLSGSPLVIPEDKTVYLLTGLTTNSTFGVTVEGTVYAGASGVLTTTATSGKITVPATGRVYVQKGGTLSTDAWTAVSDGATGSAFAAGRVSLAAGGTLAYTGTTLSLPDLTAALKTFTAGTLDVTAVTTTGTPEQIIAAVNAGGVNSSKWVVIEASEDAGSGALDIPAGLDLTANGSDDFEDVTSLYVRGKLTLDPAASLAAAKTVTVSGTLDLGVNTALTLAAINVGGVTTSGNGKIKSAIATGDLAKVLLLLDAAGGELNLEQGAALTLTVATTVKAGTTLTMTTGILKPDNATAAAALTVEGKVVLDGGTLVTGDTTIGATTDYAINIGDNGRIEAGDIVISGAGALWDATAVTAKVITIGKNSFSVAAGSTIMLKGATTINAGKGKVILSVDGGQTADTGMFVSTATNAVLSLTGDTVALDDGSTAVTGSALIIDAKGSLAVGNGGVIAIKADTGVLASGSTTAKFKVAAGAKVSINNDSAGAAAFTATTGVFAKGTFAAVGSYTGDGTFWN